MKLSSTGAVLIGLANATRISQAPLTTEPDVLSVPGESVPGDNPLQYCADATDYILSVDSLNLSPNPPVPQVLPFFSKISSDKVCSGQNLTITANGTLSETVEEGNVHITVKWGFVSLIKRDIDLCENAHIVDEKCPLEKGSVSITKEVAIPKVIPNGKYVVTAHALTKDGTNGAKKITCMTGNIHF